MYSYDTAKYNMPLQPRFKEDLVVEIGVDEAGRGSFWGPIVAGATVIPPESEWTDAQQELVVQLRDSKKISPKKREKLYEQIKTLLPYTAIGMVGADEINLNGIQWANREAFRRAIHGIPLENITSCRLLVDGTLPLDKWSGEQEVIVEGDNQYMAIAASSILAKVEHDRWIQEYCELHPECDERYDMTSSKGYGTAKHRNGIKLYGGHELHREIYIQHWLPGSTHQAKSKKNTKEDCLIQFT